MANDNTSMIPMDDDEGTSRALVDVGAISALARSEVEAQLDAAHKYKRSIGKFRQDALTMATLSVEVAESCIYSLPRGGKNIAGPSVRLAEICASAWGNIHVAARVVGAEEKEIIAMGGAWDLEKNFRYSVETRRRITNKHGRRYDDDMITVTGNAAASIAKRNAIFGVIPKAYVDDLYQRVRAVAVGDASTLVDKRAKILERLAKMGVDESRVLNALGVRAVQDIGLDELEVLIGHGTAIKNGDKKVDEVFPAPLKEVPKNGAEEGRRMSLGKPRESATLKAAEAVAVDAVTSSQADATDAAADGAKTN